MCVARHVTVQIVQKLGCCWQYLIVVEEDLMLLIGISHDQDIVVIVKLVWCYVSGPSFSYTLSDRKYHCAQTNKTEANDWNYARGAYVNTDFFVEICWLIDCDILIHFIVILITGLSLGFLFIVFWGCWVGSSTRLIFGFIFRFFENKVIKLVFVFRLIVSCRKVLEISPTPDLLYVRVLHASQIPRC